MNTEFSDLQMVTNESISWELAKELGGAVVLLERKQPDTPGPIQSDEIDAASRQLLTHL
jgi:hypothetical protein